jgi:hypothetical protein
MADFRDMMIEKSFAGGHGMEYNRTSFKIRQSNPLRPTLLYEVVLDKNDRWERFRDDVFPRLARFLRAKRLDPETGRGLVVTLFLGDRFHLIECPAFMDVYREMENLSPESFHFRVLQWLT